MKNQTKQGWWLVAHHFSFLLVAGSIGMLGGLGLLLARSILGTFDCAPIPSAFFLSGLFGGFIGFIYYLSTGRVKK